MDLGVAGKRTLVVGGSSGIGRAVVELLTSEGALVISASRRPRHDARPAPVAGWPTEIAGDLSSEAGCIRLVRAAVDRLGGLDMLVNCAAYRRNEPITRLTESAVGLTFATNVIGCLFLCREATRSMVKEGRGSIVLVGSTATASAQPGESAYRASKAALRAHAETLAVELAAFGIRVNVVTPGLTDTPFVADIAPQDRRSTFDCIPLRREAAPTDVAPAIAFLLSDRVAGYVTGSELYVDGGLHLRPISKLGSDGLRELNIVE